MRVLVVYYMGLRVHDCKVETRGQRRAHTTTPDRRRLT